MRLIDWIPSCRCTHSYFSILIFSLDAHHHIEIWWILGATATSNYPFFTPLGHLIMRWVASSLPRRLYFHDNCQSIFLIITYPLYVIQYTAETYWSQNIILPMLRIEPRPLSFSGTCITPLSQRHKLHTNIRYMHVIVPTQVGVT